MAQKNLISVNPSDSDVNDVKNAITLIENKLSFLLSLSEKDRKGGIKLGDKTLAFNAKAYDYANKNPKLVPNFVDMTEWTKDHELNSKLLDIYHLLQPLAQKIDDTMMEAGIESLGAALSFYNSVKQANKDKIPGAKAIYEDLQARFPGRTKKALVQPK